MDSSSGEKILKKKYLQMVKNLGVDSSSGYCTRNESTQL
jgi:hypothetical protein